MSEFIKDRGPWQIYKDEDGPNISIISDDFAHDVVLTINGDFGDGDKQKYAAWLISVLNEAGKL